MNKLRYLSLKPILSGLFFILSSWVILLIIITRIIPNYLDLNNFSQLRYLFPLIFIFGLISFIGGIITSKHSKNNKLKNLILLGIISATIIFFYRLSVENINYYQTSKNFSEWERRNLNWVVQTHQNNHKTSLKKIYTNYPKTLLSQLILTSSGGVSLLFFQKLINKIKR